MSRIANRPIAFLLLVYVIGSVFAFISNGPGTESVRYFAVIATGCLLLFIYAYYYGLLHE